MDLARTTDVRPRSSGESSPHSALGPTLFARVQDAFQFRTFERLFLDQFSDNGLQIRTPVVEQGFDSIVLMINDFAHVGVELLGGALAVVLLFDGKRCLQEA